MSTNSLTTPGERLRRARILAGLNTRRELEKKYQISANTLQGWEQGKNPLSEKGARRLVEALRSEGLICSTEWLLYGQGMPPRPYEMLEIGQKFGHNKNINFEEANLREMELIYRESQLFKEQNPNAVVINVSDDAMEPYFSSGDLIGGIQFFDRGIDQFLGQVCILELENHLVLPRLLQRGSNHPNRYTAACTNPNTKAIPLNLYNIRVLSAAPIVWHRKKLNSLKKALVEEPLHT